MEHPYNPNGRNNLSRRQFKEFLKCAGQSRIDARNVFNYNGRQYVYALDTPSCTIRQFYDDCDGAYIEGVGYFTRDQLIVQDATRQTPGGKIARQAAYVRP